MSANELKDAFLQSQTAGTVTNALHDFNSGYVSHCIDYGQYGQYGYYPYVPQRRQSDWGWLQYVYSPPTVTVPASCHGEVHVFACEHATDCKCGKAHRKPEPKPCGACGK